MPLLTVLLKFKCRRECRLSKTDRCLEVTFQPSAKHVMRCVRVEVRNRVVFCVLSVESRSAPETSIFSVSAARVFFSSCFAQKPSTLNKTPPAILLLLLFLLFSSACRCGDFEHGRAAAGGEVFPERQSGTL